MPNLSSDAQLLKQVLNEFAHLIDTGQWDLDQNPNIKALISDLFEQTANQQIKQLQADQQTRLNQITSSLQQQAKQSAQAYAQQVQTNLYDQIRSTTSQVQRATEQATAIDHKTNRMQTSADNLQHEALTLQTTIKETNATLAKAESIKSGLWRSMLFAGLTGVLLGCILTLLLFVH